MTPFDQDDLNFQRAVDARLSIQKNKGRVPVVDSHPGGTTKSVTVKPTGLVPIVAAFLGAARALTVNVARHARTFLKPIVVPVVWTGKMLIHAGVWSVKAMALKKDKATGDRHFNPRFFAKNVLTVAVAGALGATVVPQLVTPILVGAYYYSSTQTYKDVYVGNAGVFVNEQFDHANAPGKHVATRDEIFTVLGHQGSPNGTVIRFDLDTNLYFAFHSDSLRPDLASAKILPQSPYGAVCAFETTGIYNRIPRYFKSEAVKWWDLRAHIVQVKGCQQLDQNYRPIKMAAAGQAFARPLGSSVVVPFNGVANPRP